MLYVCLIILERCPSATFNKARGSRLCCQLGAALVCGMLLLRVVCLPCHLGKALLLSCSLSLLLSCSQLSCSPVQLSCSPARLLSCSPTLLLACSPALINQQTRAASNRQHRQEPTSYLKNGGRRPPLQTDKGSIQHTRVASHRQEQNEIDNTDESPQRLLSVVCLHYVFGMAFGHLLK